MSKFTAYTIETAPAASKATLEAVNKGFGFVPNLQAHMAESPELLAAYSTLWDLFSKTTLSTTEQQIVYLTTIFENECHYCMAGHTKLSAMQKIDDAVVQAIRAGNPIADTKLSWRPGTRAAICSRWYSASGRRCCRTIPTTSSTRRSIRSWRARNGASREARGRRNPEPLECRSLPGCRAESALFALNIGGLNGSLCFDCSSGGEVGP